MLGLLWWATGWKLPQVADRFLEMVGNAASPTALIGIGLLLAQRSLWQAMANRFVLALSFLLLMIVFRSILVPLKAVVLNLLSNAVKYNREHGEIRLGVPHDIVYPAIPAILKKMAQCYPRLRINLTSSFTVLMKEALARGELDMVLTTEETPGISSPGPTLQFTNYIEAARKAVADLKAQGASNCRRVETLTLSHAVCRPSEKDSRLCEIHCG